MGWILCGIFAETLDSRKVGATFRSETGDAAPSQVACLIEYGAERQRLSPLKSLSVDCRSAVNMACMTASSMSSSSSGEFTWTNRVGDHAYGDATQAQEHRGAHRCIVRIWNVEADLLHSSVLLLS